MQFTRRQLLAGLGGATLAGGGIVAARPRSPTFTRYTYAAPDDDTDDSRVRVAWYETYNGAFLEHQDGTGAATFNDTLDPDTAPAYVAEATGPVVSLAGVMPGDAGRLVVGLEVVDDQDAEPTDIYVRGRVTSDLDNTVNEPELVDGDDPNESAGELDDELAVQLWKDGSPYGACNGNPDMGETRVRDGSLAAAFDQPLADGELLIENLAPGSTRCVGFRWELPDTVGNIVQTDSVTFDLEFGATSRGAGNPFAGGAQ